MTNKFNYLMHVYMFMPLYEYSLSAVPWKEILDKCKSIGSNPIGNLNLSYARSSCENVSIEGPSWVGVVKEQFFGQDLGKFSLPYIISFLKYQREPRNRFSKVRELCTNKMF